MAECHENYEMCSKHHVHEWWCTKHEQWEYHCSNCGWMNHNNLRVVPWGMMTRTECSRCGEEIRDSISFGGGGRGSG